MFMGVRLLLWLMLNGYCIIASSLTLVRVKTSITFFCSILLTCFISDQSKLTTAAKSIVKICKQEMSEIETCSECYQNANTKKNSWFVEVCSRPHILLWAKLKGL